MKFSFPLFLITALLVSVLMAQESATAQEQAKPVSQSPQVKAEAKPEKRAAKVLYEEAKSYVDKTFADFNKK